MLKVGNSLIFSLLPADHLVASLISTSLEFSPQFSYQPRLSQREDPPRDAMCHIQPNYSDNAHNGLTGNQTRDPPDCRSVLYH